MVRHAKTLYSPIRFRLCNSEKECYTRVGLPFPRSRQKNYCERLQKPNDHSGAVGLFLLDEITVFWLNTSRLDCNQNAMAGFAAGHG